MPPLYYRGCWHRVSRGFLCRYNQLKSVLDSLAFSLLTGVYNPKTFILHAALLRQALAHCAKFPTAASRRSLDRVSVPVWPITLSGRLSIVALVGHYPTNWLIERGPLLRQEPLRALFHLSVLCGISPSFPGLFPTLGQVIHALLTRSPLDWVLLPASLDLHV